MDFVDQFGKKLQRAAKDLFEDDEHRSPQSLIRPMRHNDLDEVLRLIRLHDSDDYQSAKRAFHPDRFSLPHDVTAHYVIEDPTERRVVGVSGYFIDDDESEGVYWLGWTYVNPFFRGRGLGKILMNHVEQTLLGLRARKLYLSTSSLEKYQSAVKFYVKCGFAQEASLQDYFTDGEHKLILAKRLSAQAVTKAPTYTPRVDTPAPPKQDEPTVFEF